RWFGPPTTCTVISPSSNTFLFPTGGLSRCWLSPIHFWKLNACSRPFGIVLSLRRRRAHAVALEPAGLERAPRRLLFALGQCEHRRRHGAAGLAEQLLPVFRMRVEFLRRAGAFECLAHRIEAVADRLGARDLAAERKIGVVAHAAVGPGLVDVRWRRA